MKRKKHWKKDAFDSARILVYLAFFLNGIYVQFFSKAHYLCDYEGYSCPLCGMRTAAYFLLTGKIEQAVESNPLIIDVIIIAGLMIVDTALTLYRRIQKKR